jgi:hypothetical protein
MAVASAHIVTVAAAMTLAAIATDAPMPFRPGSGAVSKPAIIRTMLVAIVAPDALDLFGNISHENPYRYIVISSLKIYR